MTGHYQVQWLLQIKVHWLLPIKEKNKIPTLHLSFKKLKHRVKSQLDNWNEFALPDYN